MKSPIENQKSKIKNLIAISLLYLLLSGYQLTLPGLHYDEAFEAVPALQLLRGQPVTTFRNNGLTIAGQTFPLMTQDYIGAINTYAVMPFIAIFGATPFALRAMSVLTGLLTLNLAYLLTSYLTNSPKTGLITALLLAVDPTFIFWNRQGVFVTAVTAPIGLAATYGGLRYLHGGSFRWGMGAAFLCGLGLYAKFLFLWLIMALVGAVLLFFKPYRFLKTDKVSNFLTMLLSFILGCAPLLIYNWQTGGTWQNISQNSTTSYYGVNNLAFGHNLLVRGQQFAMLLNGSHLWYLGRSINNPYPILLLIMVSFGVIITPVRKKNSEIVSLKSLALFPLLVIIFVIFASIGTVSALWVTHFAILMPWPAMAIAMGIWFLQQNLASPFTSKALTGLGLTILVITNLNSTLNYHQALTESGGLSTHSDAIYKLSDWLAKQPPHQVVAMDWGLAAPITYLTDGRVVPVEVFGYTWQGDAELTVRLKQFVSQPNTFYLWRSPDEIIFDRSPQFKAIYRPLNLEENIENAFYERSGRPILGITRLVEKGTARQRP